MDTTNSKLEKLPLKVLLVEDDPVIQSTAKLLLSQIVDNVDVASNGNTGVQMYIESNPDVVISDIYMPEMDGLSMSRKILELDSAANIIILTSHQREDFLLDAINMGIRGFLSKPMHLEKVYQLIEKFFVSKQSKLELENYVHRIQAVFDSQESMVLTTDREKNISANKSLLQFFNLESLEEFLEKYPYFLDLFPDSEKTYMQSIFANSTFQHKEKKVKLVSKFNSESRIFLIKSNFISQEKIYVFTFTDITEIEERWLHLEQKAFTDDLTKVYNRVKFCDMFEYEFMRMQREKTNLSLLMFDIDFFKSINDTFGHKVGDDVLVNLAIVVQKTIRKTDIFARWGGEEFMILLPSTDKEGAILLAEKIRSRIEEHDFGLAKSITVSIGITVVSPEEQLDVILLRVDAALYSAKHSGRNTIYFR
jgi:diguanylate cyclase (GGDEF)-like protein